MEVAKCVQKSHWLVPNASSVTTILPRIRKRILIEWKPRNIADSAGHTHCTRKPNKSAGRDFCPQLWKGMVEMGDSAEKKAGPGFFAGVKSEFKKIIWPDKNATVKQSIAVVAISVVVGVIIAILDYVVQHGVFFITNLG